MVNFGGYIGIMLTENEREIGQILRLIQTLLIFEAT